MNEKIAAAIRERVGEGKLACETAFDIAGELDVTPRAVGETADEIGLRLCRCQLGLFGYGERRRIVEPAADVSPELTQAIDQGLILGRLPCAVAWALAARFGMTKLDVSNSVEALEVRLSQCQLGAF